MAGLSLALVLLLDFSLLSRAQSGPPLQVSASNRVYGPDGPWQAVTVQLGTPAQQLDLYPGGVFQSRILTNQLCQETSESPCGSGGLFDTENSKTIDDTSIRFGRGDSGTSTLWTYGAMLLSYSNSSIIRDDLQLSGQNVANFSMAIYPNINIVYPDGNYPLQLGELSLGPVVNQSFPSGANVPVINASLIPGYLAAQNAIPSSSFGLHVGIVAEEFKLNLSLWLGGYDASRIVGPVSSQATKGDAASDFVIDLLDIGIGVDHGGSPFSYSSREGLLSSENSSISSDGIPVTMNPSSPYLYLPNSTCAAIVKDLPVTYNAGKALYFWNIEDPQYTRIVTSPTYLSFIFRGPTGNLTINAPFQLFNLTLEAPLVSNPTPYFPCQPPQAQGGSYSLGRAFLQAAFIGVSWAGQGVSEWYLAQAPGPNTDSTPQSIPMTMTSPIGLSNNWADTWRGYWTPLPNSTVSAIPGSTSSPRSSPSTLPTQKSNSLPGGTIAGIAIGAVCAVLVAIGVAVLVLRRRRGGNPRAVQPHTGGNNDTKVEQYPLAQYWKTGEETVGQPRTEDPILELPADEYRGNNQTQLS